MIAHGLWFCDAKNRWEIQTESLPTGAPNAGGVGKVGEFPQKLAVSQKPYKIDAWFLLKTNRKSYVLYRMLTL